MVKTQISPDEVEAFLGENPGFFEGREGLLKTMRLNHHSGQAISLLEKQNDLLRKELNSHRDRLHHLIAIARDNDHLFLRLRALVLALVEASSWNGMLTALRTGLTANFQVDYVRVVALESWLLSGASEMMPANRASMRGLMPVLVDERKSWCGQPEPEAALMLFGQDIAPDVGSVALSPLLYDGRVVGVLALGTHDADYFRSSMDTLFLTYVAEVVSRLAVHWLTPPE
ncbi:DUF484 family protein [Salinispirillum sp. LH 10-3-1]|uniref:DUF484 family protein n=1 Tax=Salinispirillum sp. LH 10-3-1 TaxID=2952525 RepID=A0AB38YG05_9GAMM